MNWRSALLGLRRAKRQPHHWAIIIAAASVSVVALTAGFPWPSDSRIIGKVVAHAVSLQLPDGVDAEVSLLLEGPAHVGSFTSIEPALKGLSNDGVTIQADSLKLSALRVAANGTLRITLAPGDRRRFRLTLGGDGMTRAGGGVDFEAGPHVIFLSGPKSTLTPADNGVADIIRFSVSPEKVSPLSVDARIAGPGAEPDASPPPDEPFVLEDFPFRLLRFGREESASSSSPFVSSIDRGEITIVDTGDKLQLEQAAPLVLRNLHGRIVRLSLERDGIHVSFFGYADHIELGPEPFSHDMTPTVFDVLYHKSWIQIAGSILLALAVAFITAARSQSGAADKL